MTASPQPSTSTTLPSPATSITMQTSSQRPTMSASITSSSTTPTMMQQPRSTTMIGSTSSLSSSFVNPQQQQQQPQQQRNAGKMISSSQVMDSSVVATAAVAGTKSGASSQGSMTNSNNNSVLRKTTVDPLSPSRSIETSTNGTPTSARIQPTIVRVPNDTTVEVSIDLSDVTAATTTTTTTTTTATPVKRIVPPTQQSELRISPKSDASTAQSSSLIASKGKSMLADSTATAAASKKVEVSSSVRSAVTQILGKAASATTTLVPPLSYPKTSPNLFNSYEFLAGPNQPLPKRTFDPIYKTVPFWFLLNLNVYLRKLPPDHDSAKEPAFHYDILVKALSFLGYVMSQSLPQKDVAAIECLMDNHLAIESALQLIKILPHSVGVKAADSAFLAFINVFVPLIGNLKPSQQIVIPGGWTTIVPGSGDVKTSTHLCLYILRNQGNGMWSFTVCNTGPEGLEYHPSSIDENSGREMKQLALNIWDIPSERILDSTFWTLVFRMQIYPHKRNGPKIFYEHLLPSLNSRPLLSNMTSEAVEFLEIPDDPTNTGRYYDLALLALTCTPYRPTEGNNDVRLSTKFSSLLVKNAAVSIAFRGIETMLPSSMDYEDARILRLTGRNLANYASTMDVTSAPTEKLGSTLSETWNLLDKLLKKITVAASKPMDQHSHHSIPQNDAFSRGEIGSLETDKNSSRHPFFGRLRRDDFDNIQKALMGDPMPEPILIPVVLTDQTMPSVANDYASASSSLQRICHACSLLLQQRKQIKNAAAFAASAAQYAFTTTLPMPNLDPKLCFWRSSPMRRETQCMLLFLIRRMCRTYLAATSCVQKSRGLIAIQSISLACAACISDAISRVVAVDDPSEFSLHYSGLNEGPTEAFGIEAGSFEKLAANLPIYDPRLCELRCRCLDYLRGISHRADGTDNNTIFNFDMSMSPMRGDLVLLHQLSIQLALPRPAPNAAQKTFINNAAKLISGRNGSIIEVLPEFEYFRDIVFHFKHAVSGKSPTPPGSDIVDWLPSHATLHWTTKQASSEDDTLRYSVTAFRSHEQEFVEEFDKKKNDKKSTFLSFLTFFDKTTGEHAKLSSADPTNIVNSCSEKMLKSK